MTDFFANNFSEEKWKKAAMKNAFVLIGKQRFEHAVAFFLLADSLDDAVQVCPKSLIKWIKYDFNGIMRRWLDSNPSYVNYNSQILLSFNENFWPRDLSQINAIEVFDSTAHL